MGTGLLGEFAGRGFGTLVACDVDKYGLVVSIVVTPLVCGGEGGMGIAGWGIYSNHELHGLAPLGLALQGESWRCLVSASNSARDWFCGT